MQRPPVKEGRIFADLHAHPAGWKNHSSTLETLASPGILGLSHVNDSPQHQILTYEFALERFPESIDEIDRGLARVRTNQSHGYVLRTQEITSGSHHLLAIGCEGAYLPSYQDSLKTVDEIHARGGIAILNHPFATYSGGIINPYREPNANELFLMRQLICKVDEIETFNAQCINLTNGIRIPAMRRMNERARDMTESHYAEGRQRFKGVASSDTHSELSQVKSSGIHLYLSEEDLCVDAIKNAVRTGAFDNDFQNYVSRISFVSGMAQNKAYALLSKI